MLLERRAAFMGETETPLGSSSGSVHIQSHSGNWAGGALISGRWFSGGLNTVKRIQVPNKRRHGS